MLLIIIIVTIILLFGFYSGNCNPISGPDFAISLNITNNIKTNTKSIEFNLTLSNNEVLKVNLSFEFMSQPSTRTTPTTDELIELTTISPTTAAATTTNTTPSASTSRTKTANDEDDDDDIKFTPDEAIVSNKPDRKREKYWRNTECNSTIL